MPGFQKTFDIDARFILFPIHNRAPRTPMRLIWRDHVLCEFTVDLARDGEVDWWAHYDVSRFMGQTVQLQSFDADFTEAQLSSLKEKITQGDFPKNPHEIYHEIYRPQLRFTPQRGWNNDPNGLIYVNGEWHLFYQYNPLSIEWGPMHWGHAVSADLCHWEEKGIALYPRSLTDMAFSGGAVLDELNCIGLGRDDAAPMILSFTSTGRGECLAYSLDHGRTFQEYAANPVLAHVGRDPKIVWYAAKKKWIMIVYDEGQAVRGYDLYDSTDLVHWRWLQRLPGWFECPEFFELPVIGGEADERRWVVYGAIDGGMRSAYQVGRFDGEHFWAESAPQPGYAGPNFYAAQIFSHAPGERRIMIGWLAGADYPGMPFGHGMSLPLELSLRKAGRDYRLCFYPARELSKLRIANIPRDNLSIAEVNRLFAEFDDELKDIELSLDFRGADPVTLKIGDYPLVIHPSSGRVTFLEQSGFREPEKANLHLRIIVDRCVTEIFVDHGGVAFAGRTIFSGGNSLVKVAGNAMARYVNICKLKSIWQDYQSA